MSTRRRLAARAGIIGWAALLLIAPIRPTRAESLTLQPTDSAGRLSDYGHHEETLNPPGYESTWVLSDDFRNQMSFDAALKFDLSSISAAGPHVSIASAVFTFHVTGTQATSGGTNLYVLGGAGSDNGVVTLDDFPPAGQLPYPNTIANIGPPQIPPDTDGDNVDILISVNVSSIIATLTDSHTSFAVFGLEPGLGNVFVPRGSSLLQVTYYVPEPASYLMLGMSLGGVLVVSWRRRRTIAVTR